MARIRRELHGGLPYLIMRALADLGWRGYDHHHDGDREY
jgi:hypothetical protein